MLEFSLTKALGVDTFGAADDPKNDLQCEDCLEEDDQWSVSENKNVFWAVAFKNDTGHKHTKSILGSFGHIERLNFWTHFVSSIFFLVYAIIRTAIWPPGDVQTSFTIIAAFSASATFAVSAIYHGSSPREDLSYFTRVLDFFAIYVSISVTSLADMAVATNGYNLVHWQTILDVPLAAFFISVFFVVRRSVLPSSETYQPFMRECGLTIGLFRKIHGDNEHAAVRSATSLILATSWFMVIPTTIIELHMVSVVFVTLESVALILLIVGMSIDNLFVWPDVSYAKGERFGCSNKKCGCFVTAHSLWHIFAFVAALLSAGAREYGLAAMRVV